MTQDEIKQLFAELIVSVGSLEQLDPADPKFLRWKRECAVVVSRTFGESSAQMKSWNDIPYRLMVFGSNTTKHKHHEAYRKGLRQAVEFLDSFQADVVRYGLNRPPTETNAQRTVEKICDRFPLVARQLLHRHGGRETLVVNDEYDIQDLMHGLLRLHFDDVRAEDAVPSYAGGNSRIDFFLKSEGIVIETKMMRDSLTPKKVGEELIIDIARYQARGDVKTVIFFVFDPAHRISNPTALLDVEKQVESVRIKVIVRS
ncbi:hypothetical protein [Rhizobium rhizogenes]|uniref:PD-(D/E)XK nuclease domain-containing protein n=1 Tax=Rhizobium rhizogenes TaxID=359 RepID=UPI0022B6A71A|nr:hypothetical protein [Rhizobium rhizogenes]MCZ7448138.1 hypothetical protein [Rhizobium rhizogenes]MCZ7465799.1 hypothetical protein [Rhizobium rhizogenes]